MLGATPCVMLCAGMFRYLKGSSDNPSIQRIHTAAKYLETIELTDGIASIRFTMELTVDKCLRFIALFILDLPIYYRL